MYGMEWKSDVRKDRIIIQFSCILCYDYIVENGIMKGGMHYVVSRTFW